MTLVITRVHDILPIRWPSARAIDEPSATLCRSVGIAYGFCEAGCMGSPPCHVAYIMTESILYEMKRQAAGNLVRRCRTSAKERYKATYSSFDIRGRRGAPWACRHMTRLLPCLEIARARRVLHCYQTQAREAAQAAFSCGSVNAANNPARCTCQTTN